MRMHMRMRTVLVTLVLGLVAAGCGGPGAASTITPPAPSAPTPTPLAPLTGSTPGVGVPIAPGPTPVGRTERATVVRVVDGDTIIVDRGRGDERLRYIGIDAPESVRPDTPVEFMGKEASAANARLVDGRVITLERDVSDTDRFGRLLRYVWVEDPDRPGSPRMVNLELVASGHAQAVTFPPDVRYTDELRAAERQAREQGRGPWGEPTPAP
jgi:endonuclease YncB( thermonuclease family)